jgi:ABC-type Mn2+/Zn2+ transport system permease subunit
VEGSEPELGGDRVVTWPPFLLHAVLASTAIAAAAGLVGYFMVLRAQVFTGDTLSHVAFTVP